MEWREICVKNALTRGGLFLSLASDQVKEIADLVILTSDDHFNHDFLVSLFRVTFVFTCCLLLGPAVEIWEVSRDSIVTFN